MTNSTLVICTWRLFSLIILFLINFQGLILASILMFTTISNDKKKDTTLPMTASRGTEGLYGRHRFFVISQVSSIGYGFSAMKNDRNKILIVGDGAR
jgi:uncharacterized membrane protein